jgi:energy-coupling factor transport system permease protein
MPIVSGGQTLLSIRIPGVGQINLTQLGVLFALNNVFIILIPVFGMFLYVSVTSPYEIAQSFDLFHVPFKIGFTLSLALRFLPTIYTDAGQIVEAQMSRGLDLESRNPIRRIRSYVPIFIPLLQNMLVQTQELAISLETKCLAILPHRTYVEEARLKRRDIVVLAMIVAFWLISIYAKINGIGQSLM